MRPLLCLLGRHRRTLFITGLEHRGGGHFQSTSSYFRCARQRCEKRL